MVSGGNGRELVVRPRDAGEMLVADALDFLGAITQGFDLADARSMIASALDVLAPSVLEAGRPLPVPDPNAAADPDLVELVPLTVQRRGVARLKRQRTPRSL